MTKAELFRYLAERSGPKAKPAALRPHPLVAAEGPHSPSMWAGRKAQYALETGIGRPSRKSSRKSANRQKTDVQFRMKRQASEGRPEGRPRSSGR
jgi:hypothetical protein